MNKNAVIGQNYRVGARVLVDDQAAEIWTGTIDVKAVESDVLPADVMVSDRFGKTLKMLELLNKRTHRAV